MKRGEIWLAQVGRKRRPVLVLTRDEVLDVRSLVTVAEITTSIRGLAAEVPLGDHVGLDHESAVNCDGLHTIPQTMLIELVGAIAPEKLTEVCSAIVYAVACFAGNTNRPVHG
ncbi:MAG: type II toxin-antitoxin system PemK/MazF family toxin [Actinomycetota bacterium]